MALQPNCVPNLQVAAGPLHVAPLAPFAPSSCQAYEAKGVKRMYPWQAAALECGEAYNNLVGYS